MGLGWILPRRPSPQWDWGLGGLFPWPTPSIPPPTHTVRFSVFASRDERSVRASVEGMDEQRKRGIHKTTQRRNRIPDPRVCSTQN